MCQYSRIIIYIILGIGNTPPQKAREQGSELKKKSDPN